MVSSQWTVVVFHWANHFHGGCVSIDNKPRPGRPRTFTDERCVKLVADALEEDRHATCKELSRGTGILAMPVFRILTNDSKKRSWTEAETLRHCNLAERKIRRSKSSILV